MHVKKTLLEPTKAKLEITLHEADISPIKQATVKRLGAGVKVPGFRPGKAPQAAIEKSLDANNLQTAVLEEAVNFGYTQALEHENLRPVSQPEVAVKKYVPFTELTVEIIVDVIGKVVLPDYKKFKKTLPKVIVSADDIKEVLESIAKQMAEKTAVERPAKAGDEVFIDFKGTDSKGEPIGGADGQDYPLTLGSNAFIPGFEDNLLGLKAGAHKDFTLTFPKDYGVKALANKKVTFAVDITKVQESKPAKIDDDMAKKAGASFATLNDLKADIKKQLTLERENQARGTFESDLVMDITKKSKVEVPDVMVDEQLAQAEKEERQNLAYRGQTWEEHLQEDGVTEQEHRDKNRPVAADRVKAGLVLSEIAEQEDLSVTSEELQTRIELLRGQYQDEKMRAELDDPDNRRTVAMRILTEKTLERLTKYATSSK